MSEKAYIGTKIIAAEPMDEGTFLEKFKNHPAVTEQGREGYKVRYADGYISWSPKEIFERAYREITEEEEGIIGSGIVLG